MKIGFVGFGKMAQAIHELAKAQGHEIVCRLDTPEALAASFSALKSCEVIFEFTAPRAVVANLQVLAPLRVPVVCGTTGWNDSIDEVKALFRKYHSCLFHAPNFSIGVNIALRLARQLNVYLARFPGYAVSIEETHHTQKLDAPSGTAIALAQPFLGEAGLYPSWGLAPDVPEGMLPISAHRIDNVPGIHEVKAESACDILSIRHEAFNRRGLAEGALAAAQFVLGKTGVYTMDDLMG